MSGAWVARWAVSLLMMAAAACSPGYEGPASTAEAAQGAEMTQTDGIYQFTLDDIDGRPRRLGEFKGKVLLVVNTASMCGNTPQYAQLQTLYERYHDRGFEVLAFPANNFGEQEPGTNPEIKSFCLTKFALTFPLFSKISVKGADKHPLYAYLTERSPFPGEVEWNFQKYLVDRNGRIVGRYHHRTKPLADEVVHDVEREVATR